MKRVSLFLSERQVAAFQALAKELGRPSAELIREALDDFLRRREPIAAHQTGRKRAVTRKRP
jgi:predicted DNA-binding protein